MVGHVRTAVIAGFSVLALGFGSEGMSALPKTKKVSSQNLTSGQDEIQQALDDVTEEAPVELPDAVDPGWWQPLVLRSLRKDTEEISLSLDETLYRALGNSEQIKVFQELPSIRETAIVEADAAFDWNAFMDGKWNDLSDPVGSTLTVGPGGTRYHDHHLTGDMGVRRRTVSGGQLELSQQFGWQQTNSTYFVPPQQGTSRIVLGFTQPLMRGQGEAYNRSLVCLAEMDHRISQDELNRQTQAHLLEVARGYWAIYLERAVLLQKLKSYNRAKDILKRLKLRQAIDASQSQVKAAEAAFTDRRSDLQRSIASVKNAEARLRALVNDPSLGDFSSIEIVPKDAPSFNLINLDVHSAMAEAIDRRPEVMQALKQIDAAAIRMNMARNEIQPVLNLVTETYVAGLAGQGDVGQAWTNQFTVGQPGYSIGLQYEMPLGNRAALSRESRRCKEFNQLQHQYKVTLETVGLEVQIAVREVETSQRELVSKQQVVQAREDQLDYLTKRWERLPNEDLTSSLMLENILSAQDRLTLAEYEYLQSQISYNLSHINLRKATGTLYQYEEVNLEEDVGAGEDVDVEQAE